MVQDIYIGLDTHKNSISSQRAEGKAEPIHRKIRNRKTDLERFRSLVEKNLKPGQKVYAAYEAGPFGPQLQKQLESWGWKCFILAPHALESSQKHRNQKCDPKDALRILDAVRGHFLAGRKLCICWIPDDELRDHREIVRERVDFGDQITRIKNRINGLLCKYGITRPEDMKNPWTKQHKKWLASLCTNNSLRHYAAEKLKSNLRQLEFLESEEERLNALLEELSRHHRYSKQIKALIKEKGIGVLTAMTVLLEMGDPKRFANRKKIASYFGLVPKQFESGEQNARTAENR